MKFNDRVEMIHVMLVENEKYWALLSATYDAHAVEGSLVMDDAMAALMIRETAATVIGQIEVAKADLATIRKALGVVLRRYGSDRKQRRNLPYETESDFVVTPNGGVQKTGVHSVAPQKDEPNEQ